MLTKKISISTVQLVVMLIISRIIINLTYNSFMSSEKYMWDHVLSLIISFFTNFLFLIPVYLLYKQDTKMTIADNSINYLGKLGIVFIVVYAAYYLYVCCYTLSLFNIFISNVMDPSLSITVLSIAIMLTSCYGAYKGLEGLARASSIIMFIIVIAMIFLTIATVPQIETINYPPFLYDGTDQMLNGALFAISRMSCIPAMTMLLPFTKGNTKKGMVTWNVILHISLILFITIMVGALGEYSNTHIFPIYALTSIAEIGMFKRLDSLYIGIFTTALFVKISLFLFLFSLAITRIFNEKIGRVSIFVGGIFVAAIGIIFSSVKNLKQLFYSTPFVFTFTVLTAFIIPLFLLIVVRIKNRKDVKVEKHS